MLGIIDRESESFKDKLLARSSEWIKREKTAMANTEPEFSTYLIKKSHRQRDEKKIESPHNSMGWTLGQVFLCQKRHQSSIQGENVDIV